MSAAEEFMGYNYYDHRLRNLVVKIGLVEPFLHLVPKSTLHDWIRKGPKTDVITLPEFEISPTALITENQELRSKIKILEAEKNVVAKSVKIFGFQVQYMRLPSKEAKEDLIEAIKGAANIITLKACLNLIGLSPQRVHAWTRKARECLLQDQSSCPRSSPQKLITKEVTAIVNMFTDKAFAHYSMTQLMWLGKKNEIVHASVSTWSRVAEHFGLKRPGKRVYPPKPKCGVRASVPGQIWHLDVSIMKQADGTKGYIQAVIDNFSRYVLAWHVSPDYGGMRTKALIEKAIARSLELGVDIIPEIIVGGGRENHNSMVGSLVNSGLIIVTEAVEFSNSMIEMLFHRLKNRHLYNVLLTDIVVFEKQTDFYLHESNNIMPHSAHQGGTPLEAFTGKWGLTNINQIIARSAKAGEERFETNISLRCKSCEIT